jgi:hypothetical protein
MRVANVLPQYLSSKAVGRDAGILLTRPFPFSPEKETEFSTTETGKNLHFVGVVSPYPLLDRTQIPSLDALFKDARRHAGEGYAEGGANAIVPT